LFASVTSCASRMTFDPIGFTKMKMLSGRPGIGDIVPEITYGCVPLRLAPAAGLVNVRVLDELDAMGIQRTSPTNRAARRRMLTFTVSLLECHRCLSEWDSKSLGGFWTRVCQSPESEVVSSPLSVLSLNCLYAHAAPFSCAKKPQVRPRSPVDQEAEEASPVD